MAIPDFVNVTKFNVSGTSPVAAGNHISGSGTYRAILFFIASRDSSTWRTVSSMTWNGVACTFFTNSREQLAESNGVEVNLEVWYLLDPAASTTGAVSITLSANATRVTCHAVNIEGPTGPISVDAANTAEDDASGSQNVSIGITTGGADRLVLVASVNEGNVPITWNSPLSEVSDDPTTGGGNLPRLSVAHADQASAGAGGPYTGTLDSSDEWGAVAVSVYETPAAASALLPILLAH